MLTVFLPVFCYFYQAANFWSSLPHHFRSLAYDSFCTVSFLFFTLVLFGSYTLVNNAVQQTTLKFGSLKQKLFYYAHQFCGSKINTEHSSNALPLFFYIWDLTWEDMKPGREFSLASFSFLFSFAVSNFFLT